MRSHINKVARLFGYAHYRQAPWTALRFHHVQQLIGVLNDSGLAPKTVNATLSAIRGTAKAAVNPYQLAGDDLQRIMNVKLVRGTRLKRGGIVPAGELSSLVTSCLHEEGPAGIRDITMIGMLYICGLRRAEVVSLTVSDWIEDDHALRVLGKGNKERRVFPAAGTLAARSDWLEVRGRADGALFNRVLKGGRIVPGPLSDQAGYVLVDTRWRQAGVPPVAPHDLRRTFISTLLAKGVDVLTVQRMAEPLRPAPPTYSRIDMTWLDWYIAGAGENMGMDDLSAMRLMATAGVQTGNGSHRSIMSALLPWLYSEDEVTSIKERVGIPVSVAERLFSSPVAYQLSQDLLGRLVGANAPNTDDHLSVMREHNLYLDLPGRGLPLTEQQSIRAVFLQPTRWDDEWMVVAILTSGHGNKMTGRYAWIVDSGGIMGADSLGGSIEALPPESVNAVVMRVVKLAILYVLSHTDEAPDYLPRMKPGDTAGMNPKKRRARQKTHTLFSVQRLTPRRRDSLPPGQSSGWTLDHVIDVGGHFR